MGNLEIIGAKRQAMEFYEKFGYLATAVVDEIVIHQHYDYYTIEFSDEIEKYWQEVNSAIIKIQEQLEQKIK